MSTLVVTQTEFISGRWRGRVEGSTTAPSITILDPDGSALEGLRVTSATGAKNSWDIEIDLPRDALSDGTQIYLVTDPETQAVLHRITIIAGTPASDDLRAEIAALRAEMDQLRAAFRTEFRLRNRS